MKCYGAITIGWLLLCGVAAAQSQGYAYFAPSDAHSSGGGFSSSTFGIGLGAGGKFVSKRGFGAGAELGFVGSKDDFANSGFGLFSANGYYDVKREGKLVPFVTGGYTRTFLHNTNGNWGNVGGGLTYWLGNKAGLLFEVRDHIHVANGFNTQLLMFRLGLAIR